MLTQDRKIIQSMPYSEKGRENYDKIFKKILEENKKERIISPIMSRRKKS